MNKEKRIWEHGTTTSPSDLKWGSMVIESVLRNFGGGTFFDQTPEDVYVDCEVSDAEEEDENVT